MSTPSIAERVAAGAEWLDANVPGWVEQIDLERLSLRNSCNCVLGQLFGDFEDAPEDAVYKGAAASLGFDRTHAERDSAYRALTAEWVRVIQEHRQAAGLVTS